ncbi:hypothetical protein [Burkholderia pseudomultivorans]|uniref:Methyltransferase FkbM domain-containing protein n=1 Tax=Burkholderia pseudomultivorans TaxID=1207504 RepID=A0A132EM20_9BURK|nr:hypothetical protein [Burkholderia pseudomultivorans]KWF37389.1 hypothetical protein WT56_34155 [Burkholderia pseudomultivorans]
MSQHIKRYLTHAEALQMLYFQRDQASKLAELVASRGGSISHDEALDMLHERFSDGAELYRFLLSQRLMHATGGVVQHGPLTGFNIGTRATWRASDNGAKLLGFYEKEVCDLLAELAVEREALVDLGGADGFYAVGMVKTGVYQQCHCFEIEDASRENIAAIAEVNGVRDRVHLYGVATPTFARVLTERGVDLARSTVLIDIESAEFEVLTLECLQDLRRAHVIVEIHDFMRPHDGKHRYAELLERAAQVFDVRAFTTGPRDPSQAPLLNQGWTDTDRWLVCSESRATLMTWLHFAPKEG